MPPLPPAPQVLKTEVLGTFSSGYKWANVMHWAYTGGAPSGADLDTMAGDVYNYYVAGFKTLMPTSSAITECILTDLTSVLSAQGTHSLSTAGTRVGAEIPANATVLVSKGVTTRYRGGHPRSYLPLGVVTDLLDSGHWTSTAVTAFEGGVNTFFASMPGTTVGSTSISDEVAVSYYYTDYTVTPPARKRRTAVVIYPITAGSYIVQPEVASQRRRIGRKR